MKYHLEVNGTELAVFHTQGPHRPGSDAGWDMFCESVASLFRKWINEYERVHGRECELEDDFHEEIFYTVQNEFQLWKDQDTPELPYLFMLTPLGGRFHATRIRVWEEIPPMPPVGKVYEFLGSDAARKFTLEDIRAAIDEVTPAPRAWQVRVVLDSAGVIRRTSVWHLGKEIATTAKLGTAATVELVLAWANSVTGDIIEMTSAHLKFVV